VTVVNDVPPTIMCSATGGNLDNTCTGTVNWTATVDDNCCLDINRISCVPSVIVGNATVVPGSVVCNKTPRADGKHVDITGIARVSLVTGSRATLSVAINATACCSNSPSTTLFRSVTVVNDVPPTIMCSATGGNLDNTCSGTVNWTATVD